MGFLLKHLKEVAKSVQDQYKSINFLLDGTLTRQLCFPQRMRMTIATQNTTEGRHKI